MASMDMSTHAMSMPSMTSMSGMASATASSMPSMSHGSHGSSMMGMDSMKMVFFTSTATPLYSDSWTPSSTGAYAGACIFLIALAILFRGIIALRYNFHTVWTRWSRLRHGGILEYEYEDACVKQKRRPWRINEAAARAVLDTTLAGVSYLLMLAVMTMNVGYFISILGGTFLGSFVVGGWTGAAAH